MPVMTIPTHAPQLERQTVYPEKQHKNNSNKAPSLHHRSVPQPVEVTLFLDDDGKQCPLCPEPTLVPLGDTAPLRSGDRVTLWVGILHWPHRAL
jgi:hypothetical protein